MRVGCPVLGLLEGCSCEDSVQLGCFLLLLCHGRHAHDACQDAAHVLNATGDVDVFQQARRAEERLYWRRLLLVHLPAWGWESQ